MGRHRPNIETDEDGNTVRISGSIPDTDRLVAGKVDRTFERDSAGIQGFEYFGAMPEEDK